MRGSTVIRVMLCTALMFSFAIAVPPSGAEAVTPGWKWLNPLPSGDSLNAVSMSPTSGSACMWAVGDYGFIAKTFDYGQSWHKFEPTGLGTKILNDVDLFGDSVGWAVGENGTIVKISDGWNVTVQTSPTTNALYAVDVVNATTAVAVGAGGVIIKTTDGTNWTAEPFAGLPGLTDDLYAVWALSATQFWVGGDGHVTPDGGSNIYLWAGGLYYPKDTADTTFAVRDLYVDPASNTLWAVGVDRVDGTTPKHYQASGDVNVSMAADNTRPSYAQWAPTPTADGYFTGISRPDAQHTWMSTSQGEVFFCNDAMPHAWTEFTNPYGATGLTDLDFHLVSGSAYRGVIAGGKGALASTTDGGTTWTTRASETNAWLASVDFVSKAVGYVTAGTEVLKTADSGVSWGQLGSIGGTSLLDTDFKDTGKGWAVGRAANAAYYDGSAWIPKTTGLGVGDDLYSVCYVDDTRVWATGDSGTVTKWNGTTWTASTDPDLTGTLWYGVDFFGALNGMVVGQGGRVAYTTDGGVNWNVPTVKPASTETIYSVDMVSAMVGFAVGGDGGAADPLMWKTIDGGDNWTQMTPPGGSTWVGLHGVSFADANNGWIVGSRGIIWHTMDGGGTWNKELRTSEWLLAVSAVGSDAAWATGDNGMILTNYTAPAVVKTYVYRFYNTQNGTHFYTTDVNEKHKILATWPQFKFEGVGYEYDQAMANDWLYRIYNQKMGSHFYTTSLWEAQNAVAKWPSVYVWEGAVYKVCASPVGGRNVYRFYNRVNGSHFFTALPAEADMVKATWPNIYQYEGPGFYLPD